MALRRVVAPLRSRLPASQSLFQPSHRVPVTAPFARSFANASSAVKAPSKWKKRALIGAGLVGGYLYLTRLPPEMREQKRLLLLASESYAKGDVEKAFQYTAESFDAIVGRLPPGNMVIKTAFVYAALTETLDQHAAALPYYQTAMRHVKLLSPLSTRCSVGVGVLDRIAQCHQKLGNLTDAENSLQKAIKGYEKYLNQAEAAEADEAAQANIDKTMSMVYTHYAQLLVAMGRSGEVAFLRDRLVQLVQSSPVLRKDEAGALDQFDDLVSLEAIREARRRQRGETHE